MSMLIGKVEPGDVVGRCRIIRELGRGGVGTVYLATHQTLQIEVALKVLSPALSMDNPALAERFIREAQLAARIRHPNVIAVMDAAHDEPTQLYYIVLEYVGGGSLSWHLRHGPLPETRALAIVTGIAHALVLAEENSIVHRDIKPDNIMLDARGTAKLADLGLAKHAIDSRTSLTLGGSYMGTPAYMSPEQARDAKAADTRDDIYSLGATFYECLTGKPPFEGETPYNIMSELLTKPSPRVNELRPDVSKSADMICRKMMAKTRGLRYGDARALLADLQICHLHGDAGFARLEAAAFARDSVAVRQQALQHGVHTSAEGVADLSDSAREEPAAARVSRRPVPLAATEESRALRAAASLVALVILVAILLVSAGRFRSGNLGGIHSPPQAIANAAPDQAADVAKAKPHLKPAPAADGPVVHNSPAEDRAPLVSVPLVPPRALPVTNLDPFGTNFDMSPANTNTPGLDPNAAPGIPVASIAVQSAFEARVVAQMGLSPALITGTGQASLLKIIGRRDSASPEPRTWTFYFYDPSATGNALFITVRDGKVVKDGQAITGAVFPWHQEDVLPEDEIKVDSSAALAIAKAKIPGVVVASSAFELVRRKNEAPRWNLTLWARDREGGERELGTVSILTDTGYVISNNLAPEK